MSYVKGSSVLAADINGFLDTVKAVYGTGTGNSGYGQTAVVQANVVAGTAIASSHWTNLRSMISVCSNHQNVTPTSLPTDSQLLAGQTVFAHETNAPSSNSKDLNSHVANIATNRLLAGAAGMTLTTAAHTVTKSSTWSATITTTVDVQFGTEAAARYFFNSGGQIRIRAANPNGGSAQDVNWRNLLTNAFGTLTMSAQGCSITGTATSSVSSFGYYTLPISATSIFNGQNLGTGAYSSNDFTVSAQVTNRTGTNGANGTTIRFIVTFFDQYTGDFDSVSSGTNVVFDHYRATTFLTGISAPTYSTISLL